MASTKKPNIAIVGAGIGGLSTALALHGRGFGVQIFEAVDELKPLGVGINLLPHAVRALDEMGALQPVLEISLPSEDLAYFDTSGTLIWSDLRGIRAGYRWPQLAVHRGHLQMALLKLVQDRIGPSTVRLGHQFVSATKPDGGPVTAQFRRKSGGVGLIEQKMDVLIGADGIRSAVRSGFYPNEGQPVWNGILMCRGTTEMPPFLSGRTYAAVADAQKLIVAYPIATANLTKGTALVNWIAQIRPERDGNIPPEEWNREISPSLLLSIFADWQFDWLDVPALIRGADKIFAFPQIDREPIERWTFGRITLLGDAAHPMIPNGSNGASQAILDAVTLAHKLADTRDIGAALNEYEAERRLRTGQIVRANREFGLPRVLKIHEKFSHDIDAGKSEIRKLMRDYEKLAGFDLASVNAGIKTRQRIDQTSS